MAGLKEIYCGSNETSLDSQFKWLDNTLKQSCGSRIPDWVPVRILWGPWIRIRIQEGKNYPQK